MKRYILLVIGFIGLYTILMFVESNRVHEGTLIEDKTTMQTLLPESAPRKIVFWVADTEFMIEDEQKTEQLWSELQSMQAAEENLSVRLEGTFSIECFWDDKTVIYVIDGYGIYVGEQRYFIGEELTKWSDILYDIADVENRINQTN